MQESSPFAARCPACEAPSGRPFYSVDEAPAESVVLLGSPEAARRVPTGAIELVYCADCGFIFNQRFDRALIRYSDDYEATQAHSATFNAFHQRLAQDLIERYDLRDQTLLEIGCGQGEFLALLCEQGANRGIGFDPVADPQRRPSPAAGTLTLVSDYVGPAYADDIARAAPDFVCCKMTLEHIARPASFLDMIRQTLAPATPVVFIQVPNAAPIFRAARFWDLYYEHCSYFTAASLAGLFERRGFEVLRVRSAYDDQYLLIEARPLPDGVGANTRADSALRDGLTGADIASFTRRIGAIRAGWAGTISALQRAGQRIVCWGGSSKTVAFVSTLGLQDAIAAVVDINPRKHGTYLPGTGHPIIGPKALTTAPPDVVIVMNPVYRDEIRADLHDRGLRPTLIDLDADPARLRSGRVAPSVR